MWLGRSLSTQRLPRLVKHDGTSWPAAWRHDEGACQGDGRSRGCGCRMSPSRIIGINDVLIRVRRTGICGTDLHIHAWDAWAQEPCRCRS